MKLKGVNKCLKAILSVNLSPQQNAFKSKAVIALAIKIIQFKRNFFTGHFYSDATFVEFHHFNYEKRNLFWNNFNNVLDDYESF
jgi:hypothetical protein